MIGRALADSNLRGDDEAIDACLDGNLFFKDHDISASLHGNLFFEDPIDFSLDQDLFLDDHDSNAYFDDKLWLAGPLCADHSGQFNKLWAIDDLCLVPGTPQFQPILIPRSARFQPSSNSCAVNEPH